MSAIQPAARTYPIMIAPRAAPAKKGNGAPPRGGAPPDTLVTAEEEREPGAAHEAAVFRSVVRDLRAVDLEVAGLGDAITRHRLEMGDRAQRNVEGAAAMEADAARGCVSRERDGGHSV